MAISGGNIDADAKLARWSYDDIWRIFWMTVIFGVLLPLSRSTWVLTKNFSLAMALHMVNNRVAHTLRSSRGVQHRTNNIPGITQVSILLL